MSNIDEKLRSKDTNGKGLSKEDFTTDLKKRADVAKRYGKSAIFQGGLRPSLSVMSNPPTMSRSVSTSSNFAGFAGGNTRFSATDTNRIQLLGSAFREALLAYPTFIAEHITQGDGTKVGGLSRVRFRTDAPSFDLCFLEKSTTRINLIVDGQLAYTRDPVRFGNTGNVRYYNVNFGADTVTFAKTNSTFEFIVGGTGHAVGDIITMNGGTNGAAGTPCTVMVTQIAGSAVAVAQVLDPGAYTTLPTGTLSQVSSTGSGTGFSFAATFFARQHLSRKMREIEVLWTGTSYFYGVATNSESTLLKYTANPFTPRLVWHGDSLSSDTYLAHAGGYMGYRVAHRLGMTDNLFISAQGGTGWNVDNGIALKWSSPQRIADLIALQGDVYIFVGSQNDTAGAALTSAVTATINAVRAARPDCYIIGIGNILGFSTAVANSIAAGFAAATVQDRTVFIDNQNGAAWVNASVINLWTNTNDNLHFVQSGYDYWADIAAQYIANTLVSLSQ